ncbi:O-methyltransferase [Neolewinella litorea]|uniref:Class I SAM-dependent methyltransferase n=1 Tax=Neolewinella litorea TaxID=2562452 RepID=A0A4S4NE51_9BACT|nr:class I SAM-dependent methyltransferase [Neolewinella litorea]THH36361.1 class I SAM-dependent methyltransferase [Neolewinella litorea]
MIHKLHKHATILQRRMGQPATLRRMRALRHPVMDVVLDSLEAAPRTEQPPARQAAFDRCEAYRAELLGNHETVDYTVFNLSETATVSSVCQQASSPPTWARFLYLLADGLAAERVLEMGTNLGVSGSYLLEALKQRPGATLTTMDGVPKYVAISGRQFARITSPDQFEIIEGNYDHTFPRLLERQPDFDLLFIDGNHRHDPTLQYFHGLLPTVRRPSVWVFDDINWTPGMVKAWDTIRNHPAVTYSIDLWKLGIVIVDDSEPVGERHFGLHLAY